MFIYMSFFTNLLETKQIVSKYLLIVEYRHES